MESLAGRRKNRSHVSVTEPSFAFQQPPYPMHPASIDECFQTVTHSLWSGKRIAMDSVLVPAIVDDIVFNSLTTKPKVGLSIVQSKYSGRGRREKLRNYHSDCSVYDPDIGALLFKLSGPRYYKLDKEGIKAVAAYTFNQSLWKPDIRFLSQPQLGSVAVKQVSKLHQLIDLIAYKIPTFHRGRSSLCG